MQTSLGSWENAIDIRKRQRAQSSRESARPARRTSSAGSGTRHRWVERTRDEVSLVGEPHCAELRASGVLAIEQIVDLADHLQPPGEAIARSRGSPPHSRVTCLVEVVRPIGLVLVVLVAASEAAGDTDDIDVNQQGVVIRTSANDLDHVARDEGHPVAGLDVDGPLEARLTFLGLVVGPVALAVDGLFALERRARGTCTQCRRDAAALSVDPELDPCRCVSPKFRK